MKYNSSLSSCDKNILIHITTAVVKRTSEIYNCKLCDLITHYVFYRAAIVGNSGQYATLCVVTICYTFVTLLITSCTGNCYHLCQTHMEASHECGLLNSILPDDLIEALTCINLLATMHQAEPKLPAFMKGSTMYCKRSSRITELKFTLFRTLWRD